MNTDLSKGIDPAKEEEKDRFKRASAEVREIDEIIETLVIDSDDMAEMAAVMAKQLKATRESVEESRKTITRPLDTAKKAAMDLFRPLMDRCDALDGQLRRKLAAYMTDRAARAKAENERLRIAAQAQADALRERAAEAEKAGDHAEAAALNAVADVSVTAVATTKARGPAGVSPRGSWTGEVCDLRELVHAAAKDDSLLPLLAGDLAEIKLRAKSLKGQMQVPGIRVWEESSITIR